MTRSVTTQLIPKDSRSQPDNRKFKKRKVVDTSGIYRVVGPLRERVNAELKSDFNKLTVYDYNDLANNSDGLAFPGTVMCLFVNGQNDIAIAFVGLDNDINYSLPTSILTTVNDAIVVPTVFEDGTLLLTGEFIGKEKGEPNHLRISSPKSTKVIDKLEFDDVKNFGYCLIESSMPVSAFVSGGV